MHGIRESYHRIFQSSASNQNLKSSVGKQLHSFYHFSYPDSTIPVHCFKKFKVPYKFLIIFNTKAEKCFIVSSYSVSRGLGISVSILLFDEIQALELSFMNHLSLNQVVQVEKQYRYTHPANYSTDMSWLPTMCQTLFQAQGKQTQIINNNHKP